MTAEDKNAQKVLVVPRKRLLERVGSLPSGLRVDTLDEFFQVIDEFGFFMDRESAEDDPDFKQIIPYCIVAFGDEVFLMQRRRAGGEQRLHGLYSIGVGGHVEPQDHAPGEDLTAAVELGLTRELREEVCIQGTFERQRIGVLNDDSNAVGRVHLGVVYRLLLAHPTVRVAETEVLEGSFVPRSDLQGLGGQLETWSRLVVEQLLS